MLISKISLQQEELKKYRFSIKFASLNSVTNILGVCAGDSEIILSNISKKEGCIDREQSSSIQMDIEHINKFVWLSNYEFVVCGSGGILKYFSIMNLREESFEVHTCGITALKSVERMIYTGSSDGSVSFFDFRTRKCSGNIIHKIRNQPQPIKDIEIHNNYLYSSTIGKGRIWLWDKRSPLKAIKALETENTQNQLFFRKGSFYCGNNEGILRVSPSLEIVEKFFDRPITGNIGFCERFNKLIFVCKDSLYMLESTKKEESQKTNFISEILKEDRNTIDRSAFKTIDQSAFNNTRMIIDQAAFKTNDQSAFNNSRMTNDQSAFKTIDQAAFNGSNFYCKKFILNLSIQKDILGFELPTSNKLLTYHRNGVVRMGTLSYQIGMDD